MKKLALIFLGTVLPLSLFAHLCNDVFVQAKDNLAVKVDIRDDQLRITKSAKFRVYILNTMDRVIADIRLEVKTDDFDVKVSPSPEWKRFPAIETINKGGKKEYFEVELTRKPGTSEGKYKIALHLFNGKDKSMVFKTVDIADAMAVSKVPAKPASLKIDGNPDSSEWEKALLCTSFYEYKKAGQYFSNCSTDAQTRFRFAHDTKNLYALVDFQKDSGKDSATIYVSKDYDSTPIALSLNLQEKKVSLNGQAVPEIKLECKGTKMELSIPLSALGVEGQKSFYANLSRQQGNIMTFWRGNKGSCENPVVFSNFVLN
ncbi:MAG: hypothetical protein A2X49_00690 [Lentisphaerae bacterium GWF2_52_8]|nr:MAG: hypothetical protein A2X49_00690 [Lentisphaerae bacterium GWF2_52_8]